MTEKTLPAEMSDQSILATFTGPSTSTVEDSAVPFPQRVPSRQIPPEREPPSVIDASTHLVQQMPVSGGLEGRWAKIANMSAVGVALCLVVSLVFFLMNFVRDEAKAGREQHRDDVKTLVEPIKDLSNDNRNTIQEMKDGRAEQRERDRKTDERFEKTNETIKAALDEIRKMKQP